jgi:hydroxypyruvate reductase
MNRARARLRDAFLRAVASIDPADVGDLRGIAAPLVVAVGKAAPAMARGVLARCADVRGIVVTTDATRCALPRARFEVLRAGHPLPDARSVRAAARVMDRVRAHEGPVVFCISGGASALLCAPVEGVTLAQKRAITRRLLAAGATITEMNVVRRHLSRVKGGGLLRLARGRTRTKILSDVIDGGLEDIGSGPTVVDPTTAARARAIAKRFGLGALPFVETLKRAGPDHRAEIVAGPDSLARAVARELRGLGLRPRVLPPSRAPVDAFVAEYTRIAATLRPGQALVRAAEPSVRITAAKPGRGGRSTHLAALLARRLPAGVLFLAGASDGADGTSRTAGAVVDRCFHPTPGALERFDTAPDHRRAETAILTGPTGVNLADVHVLARF